MKILTKIRRLEVFNCNIVIDYQLHANKTGYDGFNINFVDRDKKTPYFSTG